MTESEKTVHIGDREFIIYPRSGKPAEVLVSEEDTVVLSLMCNPDAPLGHCEEVLREYIADDALPSPAHAKKHGPEEEDLWHPSSGRLLANGALEIKVSVEFDNYVTDHSVHRLVRSSWWTETGEDLGFSEGASEDHTLLPDQIISYLGDELKEGQRYELVVRIDGRGESHTHFVYSSKHWPPPAT